MLQTLGLLGGLFGLISYIPYIRDTLLLKIKPQRTAFLIWALLGAVAFFSQFAKGASNSLWLPGFEALGALTIFLLSIKYGMGGFGKEDYFAILVSAIGLIFWYITKEAAVALYLTIFVDAIGLSLIIHKVYIYPKSETNLAWILGSLGGFFALLSVGSFNIILLSYPFYLMLANASVVVVRQIRLKGK